MLKDSMPDKGLRASRKGEEGGCFPVTFKPSGGGVYTLYVWGPIEDTMQFAPAIEAMDNATEDDLVVINLSTPGGNLDATDSFVQAMRECAARIIVRATGGVHSAGTLILLNADEFVLSENFNCLIHNGEVGFGAKFSDWRAWSSHTGDYMERVMRNTYQDFLTEQEIEELLKGRDFWLDAEEFMRRWKAREAIRGMHAVGEDD